MISNKPNLNVSNKLKVKPSIVMFINNNDAVVSNDELTAAVTISNDELTASEVSCDGLTAATKINAIGMAADMVIVARIMVRNRFVLGFIRFSS